MSCGHLENVQQSARRAALRIGTAKDDTAETGMNDGPRTHWARFLGHKEIAVREPPIPDRTLSLRDGEHFRMGGRILKRLHLVPRTGDDFPIPDNDCANRHLVRGERLARKAQRLSP